MSVLPSEPAAVIIGVGAALIIAALILGYLIEQADQAWIREPDRPRPDPVSPADVSSLIQEARRITGESP
jgi:hypothetical protein